MKPIKGPIIIRTKDDTKAFLNENTFNLVSAIPKDINIKNIVAYINHSVVLITTVGSEML